MDPRVKPEDDNLKGLFLFVIPAGLKRESSKSDEHFNFFTNEPYFLNLFKVFGPEIVLFKKIIKISPVFPC
jgi:hypothetical protein